MPRSPSPHRRRRSRSRERKRRRSRSPRDRREQRDDRRDRKRSGDRDVRYRKSWSRSRSRSPTRDQKRKEHAPTKTVTAADLEGKSMDEQEMMKQMGFCGFNTTKNRKVEDNDAGEVHVILKRKYRQYMNRKGGFNRPLDFVA